MSGIVLSFTGDIMCSGIQDRIVWKRYGQYCYDPAFESVYPLFWESDYVVGNLETVFVGKEGKYTSSGVNFNTSEGFSGSLKKYRYIAI